MMIISVTPTIDYADDSFEKDIDQLFADDKFGNDSRVDVDDLEKMLTVDKEHLDCEIPKEYLNKLLDVEKYQNILWIQEEQARMNNQILGSNNKEK